MCSNNLHEYQLFFYFFYLVKYLFYLSLSDNSQKKEIPVLSKYGSGDFNLCLSFMFIQVLHCHCQVSLTLIHMILHSNFTLWYAYIQCICYQLFEDAQIIIKWYQQSNHFKINVLVFRILSSIIICKIVRLFIFVELIKT